jgi:hypothetical protein
MVNNARHSRLVQVAIVSLAAVGLYVSAGLLHPVSARANSMQRGEWILAIAPGDTLRVIAVSNPWSRKTAPVGLTFQVFDEYGTPLFESPEIQVSHGAMEFADVARHSLAIPGEPQTGRLQLRVVYAVVAPPGSRASDFVVFAEVFDQATGRTITRTGPVADVLYSAAGNSGDQ